jgi:hypothetical protein
MLEILGVKDKGDIMKEYLRLKVLETANLQGYAVHDTTYTEKKISNKEEHFFQFPDKDVMAGDYIWLFTGKGKPEPMKNKDGTATHKLYWNLGKSIWNQGGDKAYVLEISQISSLVV